MSPILACLIDNSKKTGSPLELIGLLWQLRAKVTVLLLACAVAMCPYALGPSHFDFEPPQTEGEANSFQLIMKVCGLPSLCGAVCSILLMLVKRQEL